MSTNDDGVIRVHDRWDGWRNAEVRLRDLHDVHWFQPSGAPHPIIHAYISCTEIVYGAIPHDCDRSSVTHRLQVCVLKRHTLASTYSVLAQRADKGATSPPAVRGLSAVLRKFDSRQLRATRAPEI